MSRFILKRLILLIPLVIGITLISFGVMQLAPGNYLTALKGNPQIRPETIQRLEEQFGLNQHWIIQYGKWLGNAVQGNFGYSFTYKVPAFELISSRLYYTFLLSFWSTVFSWVVAIPLGIYVATHRNTLSDRIANFCAFAGISLPGFFVALLVLLLARDTGWFPIGGATSDDYDQFSWFGKVKDTAWHLFLPVLVLGTRGVAGLMRQMRGNLLDVLGENYILAAHARGLAERKVILKHGVRNAINPLITIFGAELSGLLAGSALVERVMQWPGLGRLMLDAVQSQDLYVAMASFVMGSTLLILGNLIADLLLAITDPRIKYS